jgi:DnaJ-class molecular chaperone
LLPEKPEWEPCPICGGEGKVDPDDIGYCPECDGAGRIPVESPDDDAS